MKSTKIVNNSRNTNANNFVKFSVFLYILRNIQSGIAKADNVKTNRMAKNIISNIIIGLIR